jgi:hypothetical protein
MTDALIKRVSVTYKCYEMITFSKVKMFRILVIILFEAYSYHIKNIKCLFSIRTGKDEILVQC